MTKRIFIFTGLLMALLGNRTMAAEPVWCLLTDKGVVVAMNQVACLVAADEEATFGVVMKDGGLIDGVSRVTFERTTPTDIKEMEQKPFRVNKDLSLEGVSPETPVYVYDASGKLLRQGVAKSVELSDLQSGIYLIRVNQTTFKIRKQ